MGAGLAKLFDECELHINCSATWFTRGHDETDTFVILGADEGIYMLSYADVETAHLVHPRRYDYKMFFFIVIHL